MLLIVLLWRYEIYKAYLDNLALAIGCEGVALPCRAHPMNRGISIVGPSGPPTKHFRRPIEELQYVPETEKTGCGKLDAVGFEPADLRR